MADTDYAIDLHLREARYENKVTYKVVAHSMKSSGSYDLTKEYPSSHEALDAFASTLRKLTVESAGDAP